MKKILSACLGAMAIALMLFNFSVGHHQKETRSTTSLKNIQAMTASAGELCCDGTNTNSCDPNSGSLATGSLILY